MKKFFSLELVKEQSKIFLPIPFYLFFNGINQDNFGKNLPTLSRFIGYVTKKGISVHS